jgi:hypothetical protein
LIAARTSWLNRNQSATRSRGLTCSQLCRQALQEFYRENPPRPDTRSNRPAGRSALVARRSDPRAIAEYALRPVHLLPVDDKCADELALERSARCALLRDQRWLHGQDLPPPVSSCPQCYQQRREKQTCREVRYGHKRKSAVYSITSSAHLRSGDSPRRRVRLLRANKRRTAVQQLQVKNHCH